MEESSIPAALLQSSTTQGAKQCLLKSSPYIVQYISLDVSALKTEDNVTFLLGECMTGAGGEGGPRGIFLLILKQIYIHSISIDMSRVPRLRQLYSYTYLNRGGSIGSLCISTIRMTLCLAPELNATPCWDGVYL